MWSVSYTFLTFPLYSLKHQSPVVQSIVSLTCSLMTNSLTVVAKVFQIHWYFCWCVDFATHILSAKHTNILPILQDKNFNVTLASNFVKFLTTRPRYEVDVFCFRFPFFFLHRNLVLTLYLNYPRDKLNKMSFCFCFVWKVMRKTKKKKKKKIVVNSVCI